MSAQKQVLGMRWPNLLQNQTGAYCLVGGARRCEVGMPDWKAEQVGL